MAVEKRRACGYRKVGGLYLVGQGWGVSCDRLPFPLVVCPCCHQGIKQSRGWTWVDVPLMFGGNHQDCQDWPGCPLCHGTESLGRAGLLWIGERFYSTPETFLKEAVELGFSKEAVELGFSRRISAIPRGFELGKTWVLLAHPKGMTCPE